MHILLVVLFTMAQLLWLGAVLTTLWFYSMPVNVVRTAPSDTQAPSALPKIILFYPVLRELEGTMRTTFTGMIKADYPSGLVRVIAIPNADDLATIQSLRRLQTEFDFIEVMPVPPTSDPTWDKVWSSWEGNDGAYWWHQGKRARDTNLPPKKTRQLIWATYQVEHDNQDTLLSYIDADSVIPADYWMNAAVGMTQYDVVQHTNITGNLLSSWPASFYALDHIAWDSSMYKHMSANGKQPFYVLGKGMVFRFRDVIVAGGFHPWLTIEDPEIGMRLWSRGARLGVVESPLIEEVPATWRQGVLQRGRWIAGFFQSLGHPLKQMGMSPMARFRARLNFVPCLSLAINPLGFGVGIWALIEVLRSHRRVLPVPVEYIALLTLGLAAVVIGYIMVQAYRMTRPVLATRRERLWFVARVNPVFLLLYWLWWTIPLAKGFMMYLTDGGLEWERTEKRDANHDLIRGPELQPVADRKTDGFVPERMAAAVTGPTK